MYAQITTRCNMSCAHCCFDCTADGEDMDIDVFHKIVQSAGSITLGGGEPTIHPKFWEFLDLTLEYTSWSQITTNGSMTEIAIELAAMAKEGKITCTLSQDVYHDPIHPAVIKAFEGATLLHGNRLVIDGVDERGVRDVTTGVVSNNGRCDWGEDFCCCKGTFIKPSGAIHACGCADAPIIGHVYDGFPSTSPKQCHKHEVSV